MKTVIEFMRSEGTDRLSCLATWTRLGRERGWNHQHAECGISVEDAKRLLKFWKPDGCIVNNDRLPAEIFSGIPTVFLHRSAEGVARGAPVVEYDERAIAECAARELLQLNLECYAFVPDSANSFWCRERERWFVNAMRLNSKGVSVFETGSFRKRGSSAVRRVSEWLRDLPRPLGVFAANDAMARIVADACVHSGIKVPDEVAIVGVDNDVFVCENAEPTLSSIAFDEKSVPVLCSDLLDSLMSGKHRAMRRTIQPQGIIRRASTMRHEKCDPGVSAALELIRLKACEGLTAADVAATFDCSRRMAQLRFRDVTGKSIIDAIIETRLEKARTLLKNPQLTQSYIANQCGYASWTSLFEHLRSRKSGRTS